MKLCALSDKKIWRSVPRQFIIVECTGSHADDQQTRPHNLVAAMTRNITAMAYVFQPLMPQQNNLRGKP